MQTHSRAALSRATSMAAEAVLAHRQGAQPVTEDAEEDLGVGGCGACDTGGGGGQCSTRVPTVGAAYAGACYEKAAAMMGCPLSAVAGGQLAIAAGGAISFTIPIDNSDYFAPVFCRLSGRSAADPTARIPWKMTDIRIGNVPQECYSVTAPDPATEVRGVWSESYDTFSVDGKTTTVQPGIRVRWGCFSLNTLSKSLRVTGFSAPGAAAAIDVNMELWGYCIDKVPFNNCPKGKYPGDHAEPEGYKVFAKKAAAGLGTSTG